MPAKRGVQRSGDHFFDERTGTLKINCLGKRYGPSLEQDKIT